MKLDALVGKLLGLLGRGLAVDRAMLDLAVVHLARFLGKLLSDIVGVLHEVVAELLELLAKLALRRRHHRDRRGSARRRRGCIRAWCGRIGALLGAGDTRRHDRLLDLGGIADWAGNEPALGLLVEGCRARKP